MENKLFMFSPERHDGIKAGPHTLSLKTARMA
jgi:hypothetical protein